MSHHPHRPANAMRSRRFRPSAALLAAMPFALAACADGSPTGDRPLAPEDRPSLSTAQLQDDNGVIVTYAASPASRDLPATIRKAVEAQGAEVLRVDPASRLAVVRGLKNAEAIAAIPEVGTLAPNLEHQLLTDQSGAGLYATLQQNLPQINVPAAWANTAFNGANTRVCIIDSGINTAHPDVAGLVVADSNFVNAEPAASDGNAHGTHVGSTVVANGIGMASVAPGARLLNARVFDDQGGGATTDRVVAAIRWCGRNGAHVINMSLGFNGGLPRGTANTNLIIALEQAAIDEVLNGTNPASSGTGGTITVASAGNDGARIPSAFRIWVPAELNNVVSVGATSRAADTRPTFTNRGTGVDIWAPGASILAACTPENANCGGASISTFNGARYMLYSGTSMAAPHVAGVMAIAYSSYGGVRSAATAAKVTSCVMARAVTNTVVQRPDPAGRRADAFRAQTGRALGAAGCPA